MSKENKLIIVQDINITVSKFNEEDYICVTDIDLGKEGNSRAADVIKKWLRNRITLEFLGTWEHIYNPTFKVFSYFCVKCFKFS